MKRFHLLVLTGVALACEASLFAQNLRTVPDGTRLENNLLAPIHVDVVDPPGEGAITRVRLQDASGYIVDVFAKRTMVVNIDMRKVSTVQLFLQQAPGKLGSVPIQVNSDQEASYLTALSSGLEHYSPGWTKHWSVKGHEALEGLIRDLTARRNASIRRSSALEKVIGRD